MIIINPSHQLTNKCSLGDTEAAHTKVIAKHLHAIFETDKLVKSILIGDAPATADTEALRRKWAIVQSNAVKGSMHLGIHTNAGGARGVEAIYYSDTGKAIATDICNRLTGIFAPRTPLVYRNKSLEELNSTKAPAVILELGFHDSIEDAKLIHDKAYQIADAIARGVYIYLDIVDYKKLYIGVKNNYDMLKADLKKLIAKYN